MNLFRRKAAVLPSVFVVLLLAYASNRFIVSDWFSILFWPYKTGDRIVAEQDFEFAWAAVRAQWLPRASRIAALRALLKVDQASPLRSALTNSEVEWLIERYSNTYDESSFVGLYVPYLDGQVNPRLKSILMDPDVSNSHKFFAFMELTSTNPPSSAEKEVQTLFQNLEPRKVQEAVRKNLVKRNKLGKLSAENYMAGALAPEGR